MAIPVYNRAAWISKTLDHIFEQSIPVDEVVLCDDGSTDNLEQALEPYRSRVKLIQIENSGPAIARKTAIENSQGDWIALCDSDDFWRPDHIESFLSAKAKFPESNLYFANFITTDEPDHTKFEFAPEGWFEQLTGELWRESKHFYRCEQPFLRALLEFQACFQSCLLFKRELYQATGGICKHVSRWPSEDFHLTARMAAISDGVICTKQTVLINKHGENFSAEYVKNLEGEVSILLDLLDQGLLPETLLEMVEQQKDQFTKRLFRSYYWTSQFTKAVELARGIPGHSFSLRDRARLAIAFVRGRLSL
ncbi:hypothetical protein BKP64_04615 [Marinobacter salinus]|uniref:Glycosyltransferase 2-like domain-containing protein n=1 Tax=Marinobacter salinus TaxID=1874317 RepID=A0A1D9GIY5_9GAMM|nr:hypothetical protein BKP64_04615 [Marinobacter salinus]